MEKICESLIEYNGINANEIKDIKNFNQVNLGYNFQILDEKPNIESINKVWVDSCIEDYKVIKTPVGVSLEGQRVTGYKLLISGDLNIKIEYISNECVDSIHTVKGQFPFCNYITLPEDYTPSSLSIIFPYICIEDIFCEVLNPRAIYNNISIILIANIC